MGDYRHRAICRFILQRAQNLIHQPGATEIFNKVVKLKSAAKHDRCTLIWHGEGTKWLVGRSLPGRNHLVLHPSSCVTRSFACLGKIEEARRSVDPLIRAATTGNNSSMSTDVLFDNLKSVMALRRITTGGVT